MSTISFGPEGSDRRGELATVGPIIDVSIHGLDRNVPAIAARGLIDTGASVVCIDRRIALQLGLQAIDQADVGVAGGLTISSTIYMGYLTVPVLGFTELSRLYAAPMRQATHDVLLGRSFLKNFIVTFNGPEGMFHFHRPFSFSGPAPDDDYAT